MSDRASDTSTETLARIKETYARLKEKYLEKDRNGDRREQRQER